MRFRRGELPSPIHEITADMPEDVRRNFEVLNEETARGARVCPRCGQWYSESGFRRGDFRRQGEVMCWACHERQEGLGIDTEEARRYAADRALQRRARQYGMDADDYRRRFEEQSGRCAICCQPSYLGHLVIDHCHESGVVRGLLCDLCNQGLGRFRDDINALRMAIEYLERAKAAQPVTTD